MFYKHAFLEAESQTLVTKAKSFAFTVQVNLRTITQVLTAGGHICCHLGHLYIISEAVDIQVLSKPYPPPRALYSTWQHRMSLY